jgi:hypothetical protein
MTGFRWPSHEAPFGTCPECGARTVHRRVAGGAFNAMRLAPRSVCLNNETGAEHAQMWLLG